MSFWESFFLNKFASNMSVTAVIIFHRLFGSFVWNIRSYKITTHLSTLYKCKCLNLNGEFHFTSNTIFFYETTFQPITPIIFVCVSTVRFQAEKLYSCGACAGPAKSYPSQVFKPSRLSKLARRDKTIEVQKKRERVWVIGALLAAFARLHSAELKVWRVHRHKNLSWRNAQ